MMTLHRARRDRRAPSTIGTRMPAVLVAAAWLLCAPGASAQQAGAPPAPAKAFTGTAGVGLSLTSGNSDTTNFNVAFDLTHDPKTRNVMKWTGLYLRGKKDEALTVNRTSLGFRDEFTLSNRTFVFGQVGYLRDTFKLIDYLIAPTAGLGYKLIDTDTTKFAVDAGAGAMWEKNPGRDVRSSLALTAGEKLVHQLTPTASLTHAATGLWKANDLADGLYTVSIGLATQISGRVQLSVDVLDTFKNRPPTPTTKKNDVAIVTAITAKF